MVDQARRGALLVLDEPVAVAIAPLIDPARRGVERRSQLAHRVEVERPAVVAAGDHQEQRRRVDRAVIGRMRDVPGAGELAGAQLVQDLSRLGIAPCPRRAGPASPASTSSVPRATSGLIISDSQALSSESRPNGATYQGMPAAGS